MYNKQVHVILMGLEEYIIPQICMQVHLAIHQCPTPGIILSDLQIIDHTLKHQFPWQLEVLTLCWILFCFKQMLNLSSFIAGPNFWRPRWPLSNTLIRTPFNLQEAKFSFEWQLYNNHQARPYCWLNNAQNISILKEEDA